MAGPEEASSTAATKPDAGEKGRSAVERSRTGRAWLLCLALAGQAVLCAAAGGECLADSLASAQIDVPTAIDEPIVPLTLTLAFDPDRDAIGEKLFPDRRLSHEIGREHV